MIYEYNAHLFYRLSKRNVYNFRFNNRNNFILLGIHFNMSYKMSAIYGTVIIFRKYNKSVNLRKIRNIIKKYRDHFLCRIHIPRTL